MAEVNLDLCEWGKSGNSRAMMLLKTVYGKTVVSGIVYGFMNDTPFGMKR